MVWLHQQALPVRLPSAPMRPRPVASGSHGPGDARRVAKLKARWDAYRAQRGGLAHYTVYGASADLAAFVDDVSTLEGLHDAVVGLIDPANHGPLTFAQECGLLACTKLQALAISAAELQLNPVETKGVRH